MAMVVKVRFRRASKLYDFDVNGLDVETGTYIVTETVRGMEIGECMSEMREVSEKQYAMPLKPILRLATATDLAIQRENEEKEKQALIIAEQKVLELKLDMKLVDVEYSFDRTKITFFFTAEGRVDFRILVKSLASVFKTRIELRQIGVRDEAKMIGGLGPCGRPICCRQFLVDFQPVSIKMAKEQNLSLNPTKISGICDRLMCCLKYEQDHYESTRKKMPKIGRELITADGVGVITSIDVLSETVTVRLPVGDAFENRVYPIDECSRVEKGSPGTVPVSVQKNEKTELEDIEMDLPEEIDSEFPILGEIGGKPAEKEAAGQESQQRNKRKKRHKKSQAAAAQPGNAQPSGNKATEAETVQPGTPDIPPAMSSDDAGEDARQEKQQKKPRSGNRNRRRDHGRRHSDKPYIKTSDSPNETQQGDT